MSLKFRWTTLGGTPVRSRAGKTKDPVVGLAPEHAGLRAPRVPGGSAGHRVVLPAGLAGRWLEARAAGARLLLRRCLVTLAVGLGLSCGRQDTLADTDRAGASTSASAAVELHILPGRAEVVSIADALAVHGARLGGKPGGALVQQAAELRERLWRLERKEADGLEAMELYHSVGRLDPSSSCTATLARAILRGAVTGEPALAYQEAFALRAIGGPAPCMRETERVLAMLGAFRPPPGMLPQPRSEGGVTEGQPALVGAAPPQPSEQGGVVPLPKGARAAASPTITAIERYGAKDTARIVAVMTEPAVFHVGFLPGTEGREPRLYVDIAQATYRGPLEMTVGGIVRRVRVGNRERGTRIVLDLERPAYRKVFYLPEPFRLVVDVTTEMPAAASKPVGRGREPVRRVVLDPGHGGHDPGALGPNGLREKDVTLDIAHRTAPLIARELGISALLTRDTDDFVPLAERTARANAFQADLFISIHCNAEAEGRGSGVMTFVLDESTDALASRIAALENAASPSAGAELATALRRVSDHTGLARSVHFAELLQRAATASLAPKYSDVPNRGVRRAGFYVLAGAHMPAVLYEVSFISDPSGELRLNTGDYRQKLADSIVNAVRAYTEGR